MSDLSREELRAHLSAVEAQVRAALRIIAAESKSVQQAHSALRADLSSALLRLQSDITTGHENLGSRIEKALTEIDALQRQRRMTTAILTTLVLVFGVTVGLVAGGSWLVINNIAKTETQMQAPTAVAPASEAPAQTKPPSPVKKEETAQATAPQTSETATKTTIKPPSVQATQPEAGFILNSN